MEWHPTKNGELTPRDVTPGSHMKVWWICSQGHEWKTRVAHRTGGHGCPRCNNSKGERAVRYLLENKNIEFNQEHRFGDCKDKNKLPFDFYLHGYNLCIEYDGEQHYKYVQYIHKNEKRYLQQRRRDRIKNQYCLDNNITLLRIHQDDYKNIGSILNEVLFKDPKNINLSMCKSRHTKLIT